MLKIYFGNLYEIQVMFSEHRNGECFYRFLLVLVFRYKVFQTRFLIILIGANFYAFLGFYHDFLGVGYRLSWFPLTC